MSDDIQQIVYVNPLIAICVASDGHDGVEQKHQWIPPWEKTIYGDSVCLAYSYDPLHRSVPQSTDNGP